MRCNITRFSGFCMVSDTLTEVEIPTLLFTHEVVYALVISTC